MEVLIDSILMLMRYLSYFIIDKARIHKSKTSSENTANSNARNDSVQEV